MTEPATPPTPDDATPLPAAEGAPELPETPAPGTPLPTNAPLRASARAGWTGSPAAWITSLALAAVVGALLFVGGYLAAGGTSGSCAAPNDNFAAFCEAYDKLQQQFVDPLNDSDLAGGAIQGMFQYGLNDPFSGYMPPEQYQSAIQDLSGTFTGIGAEMGVKNLAEPGNLGACTQLSDTCVIVVIAPLQDSPAEAAGLQAGDIMLAVDGESVIGSNLNDQVAKVRGPKGTDVTLTIRRDGETMEITITRDEIQSREVTSRMLEDGTTGYVALHGFTTAAANQFHDALVSLLDQGATAIIFDLRDNGGGYIEAANTVASEFVKSGLIFSQESADDQVKRWEATGDGAVTDPNIPVAVLVNGGSASASEIVTAALKETGRATIVGQPTYGKNTVQLWEELANGGGVRITISRWFTPDHHSVAPDGVQPDVSVEVPDGTPPERDLFVEAALEALANRSTTTSQSSAHTSWAPSSARWSPATNPVSYDGGGRLRAWI
jgi:carboxyl-terminal processing protease